MSDEGGVPIREHATQGCFISQSSVKCTCSLVGVYTCAARGQDVWSELGPPSASVAKGADAMLIHMRAPAPSGADYFYSYHARWGGACTCFLPPLCGLLCL